MDIIQKPVVSYSSRGAYKPIAIVNHISTSTMGSMFNTFKNTNNKASSHFGVSRTGEIVQYVQIDKAAWTQGKIQLPTSPLIKQMMGNPNLYCVSIEFEGYPENGIEGDLTPEQFKSACWLHKYIQYEVGRLYGTTFELNSHSVIGHYQIDSRGKPLCPGRLFPWNNLYTEMVQANTMSLEEYEERLDYKESPNEEKVMAFAFVSRVEDLKGKLIHEKYGNEASRKLLLLTPILSHLNFHSYFNEVTPLNICSRVRGIYESSLIGKYEESATRGMITAATYAKEKGIM